MAYAASQEIGIGGGGINAVASVESSVVVLTIIDSIIRSCSAAAKRSAAGGGVSVRVLGADAKVVLRIHSPQLSSTLSKSLQEDNTLSPEQCD